MFSELTADTLIRDGEVYRWDFDGSPRFYYIRLYSQYRNRLQVRVELEGDPLAYDLDYCDDDAESINATVWRCVGGIEDMMGERWDRENAAERDGMELDYLRSRM